MLSAVSGATETLENELNLTLDYIEETVREYYNLKPEKQTWQSIDANYDTSVALEMKRMPEILIHFNDNIANPFIYR